MPRRQQRLRVWLPAHLSVGRGPRLRGTLQHRVPDGPRRRFDPETARTTSQSADLKSPFAAPTSPKLQELS